MSDRGGAPREEMPDTVSGVFDVVAQVSKRVDNLEAAFVGMQATMQRVADGFTTLHQDLVGRQAVGGVIKTWVRQPFVLALTAVLSLGTVGFVRAQMVQPPAEEAAKKLAAATEASSARVEAATAAQSAQMAELLKQLIAAQPQKEKHR